MIWTKPLCSVLILQVNIPYHASCYPYLESSLNIVGKFRVYPRLPAWKQSENVGRQITGIIKSRPAAQMGTTYNSQPRLSEDLALEKPMNF